MYPEMMRYLQNLGKSMFSVESEQYDPAQSIRIALVTKQLTVDALVEQLKIGIKEALGEWIIQHWEKTGVLEH